MQKFYEFDIPDHSNGEALRAKLEEALDLPVTEVGQSSRVGVTSVGGKFVVRYATEGDDEPSDEVAATIRSYVEAHNT